MLEAESVRWCSLFCKGNEAIGDLEIEISDDESVPVPVCQECMDEIEKDPRAALVRILGPVIDS